MRVGRPVRSLLRQQHQGEKAMTVAAVANDMIKANGAELYCETRGHGPAVLFISGATGDAGHFAEPAERLADKFTVITYDRRGNSRSPRPAGWTRTSIREQAADADALVRTLGVAPVAAFGTSGGGDVGIELMLRYPATLRGIVIHEPALIAPLMSAEEAQRSLAPLIEPRWRRAGRARPSRPSCDTSPEPRILIGWTRRSASACWATPTRSWGRRSKPS
jgi:pimeloyl-ACP methyl ester carboxylesterase